MTQNGQVKVTENTAFESLANDEWLMDDGLGTQLFGADIWNQVNTGKVGKELENYIEDIKESARVAIDQSIAILTPWFFSNMPQFYYQTTPRSEKVRDLHAIITGHIFESKQKLQLWNRDKSKTTFLAPGNDENVLMEIANGLTPYTVKHGAMFTSNDRLLLIASFFTSAYQRVDMDNKRNADKIDRARKSLMDSGVSEAQVDDFLNHLDNDMVIHSTPGRMVRLYKLFELTHDREDAVTHLIPSYYNEFARLDIAYKKMPVVSTLASLLHLADRYEFQINRCMIDTVNQHTENPITIMTLILRHDTGKEINDKFVPFLRFNKAAKTLRWVDTDHFDKLWHVDGENEDEYSLNEINLIRGIAVWTQIFLSKKNPYYYSEERIRKTFSRYPKILKALVDYFKARFDPRIERCSDADLKAMEKQIMGAAGDANNPIERDIFVESLNFLRHILKTNYFFPRKTGIAFRMDPDCLNPTYYPNKPFGFFFMVGRGYRGFHVRYRDTARGGMRIVMPRDASQYEVNFAGLFDENVGLAYAQQLKNKDIPEGGAKAVLVLQPGADRETAALGAVDSMLNLITYDENGQCDPTIIDYYGQPEYVFLGPDENITNHLIDAFVRQAHRRGYRYPNAFMSSKPGAGINHKEYGVTSEGVNVFLDNLLGELGIDPTKESFTIKMTGGPDGDVAGNELKILHREYGENPKVVAVGDGSGCAYDPEGLNWQELLRLVEEGLPILDFNKDCLSSQDNAFVIPADTPENVRMRNTIHATVKADIFIPAGGRPYTVHEENWKLFFDENGDLTVRAIVEGANIFFTEGAREALQDAGVMIFKDSSANKCGVICSSFEILASLILNTEEFLEIKEVYVEQVLERLRAKADFEAKLLLREFHERGKRVNLVELSKILSKVINRVTDLISADLDGLSDEELRGELFDSIILDYIPDSLTDRYQDRIFNEIPRSYLQAIVCADTASRLVYQEGISWFENLADEDVVRNVRIYLSKERKVAGIVNALDDADVPNKEDIVKILRYSGARALTQLKIKV